MSLAPYSLELADGTRVSVHNAMLLSLTPASGEMLTYEDGGVIAATTTAIPEPGTGSLLAGLLACAGLRWLRKARQQTIRFLVPMLMALSSSLISQAETAKPERVVAAESVLECARGPAGAPVSIVLFTDFECPFCARLAPVVDQIIKAYPDKVRLTFKHNPLPMHADAPRLHAASLAAARQGQFWPMHDRLFGAKQKLDEEGLVTMAQELKLDVAAFRRDLKDEKLAAIVQHDAAEAKALGATGTPTLFINGQKMVGARNFEAYRAVIDAELGLGNPNGASEAPAARADVNLNGAPRRGSPNAAVRIAVFSDLQCPFCGRANGVLEELLRRYAGTVQIAFKHYPLPFHQDAPLAHEAALAAGEQRKFWEMHDALFARPSLKREDLIRTAGELGLNTAQFTSDLDSRKFKPAVEADIAEGARVGVSGTPTFFVNGRRLVGALPLEEFVKVIDQELAAAVGGK